MPTPASSSSITTDPSGAPTNAPTSSASEIIIRKDPPPQPPPAALAMGVDEAALDPAVDACDDFYAYACGNWIKATPIPDDKPLWTRSFSNLDDRNEAALRETLEADQKGKSADPYAQKLADFWGACMDAEGVEKAGLSPLKEAWTIISALDKATDGPTTAAAVASVTRELYLRGFTPLFALYSGQDFGDATQVIGQLEQGGLGLPDRDYYLKEDAKSAELRGQYEEHVARMLELAGDSKIDAKASAMVVVALETELAKASMTRVDRRDPQKTYHRMTLEAASQLSPSLALPALTSAFGVPTSAPINVAQPDFFKAVEGLAGRIGAGAWRSYFRYHVVAELASAMPQRFVDEDFRFRSLAFTGQKEIQPRWKRCIDEVQGALGEALAQPFVRDRFGAEGKEQSQKMIAAIEAAMKRDLDGLGWMDAPTRKKAHEKLGKINNKIGYPDVWRNYDALAIGKSYAENVERSSIFELRRTLAKIGKPVDRKEWFMVPNEVNAYYDASLNEMVFPAGILQPPFFQKAARLPDGFGAIGMVMGHELTHGFDDEGRQFDGDGNLKEWWSEKVGKDFDKRADCVVKQFDDYVAIDELHVNGKLTLGENIADLGGIKLAWSSYKEAAKAAKTKPAPGEKFTDDQRFFLSFAQAWCTTARPEIQRLRTNVDAHSPPKWRVNGPLSNTASFATAFKCKAGSKMIRPPKDRCEIW